MSPPTSPPSPATPSPPTLAVNPEATQMLASLHLDVEELAAQDALTSIQAEAAHAVADAAKGVMAKREAMAGAKQLVRENVHAKPSPEQLSELAKAAMQANNPVFTGVQAGGGRWAGVGGQG